jgi:hypothetical protein
MKAAAERSTDPATELVTIGLKQGRNPLEEQFTVLGSILKPLINGMGLDVGCKLVTAITRNKLGTGFLIGSNVVLTCYHVLGDNDAAVTAAARKTTLRFGALTNFAAKEDQGQVIVLDQNAPVLCSSEVSAHIFYSVAGRNGNSQL